ncbi:MAG: DUF2892 domain-containing protein [Candidatus Micrarchaeia archaeon]
MNLFEKNVGTIDRAIRIIIGLAMLFVVYMQYVQAPISYGAIVIAIIMFATAVSGSCAIYSIFGLNTGATKKKTN